MVKIEIEYAGGFHSEAVHTQSGTRLQPRSETAEGVTASSGSPIVAVPASYQKFTSQQDLGRFLMAQYHIRTANELASCETCHR